MRGQELGVNTSTNTISHASTGKLLLYLKQPLLAATTIALSDLLALIIGVGSVPRTTLVLILFLEGGIGLIVGVIIALSSAPSIAKLGELTMGAAPWSRDSEKHAEKIGSKWMVASAILVAVAFLISAL